jgi:Uma2 family endonuclease
MAAAVSLQPISPYNGEQRMLLSVSWTEYLQMRALLDDGNLRMTYLKGSLELMSPSPQHEIWKKSIARFVELYCHIRGIELHAYGSTTFKRELKERGAEPDECYSIGKELKDYPEIALEVIHTAPLLNKLEIYVEMQIAEVWVFRDGRFTLYALQDGAYQAVERSERLPGLDFVQLAGFVVRSDIPQALREFDALTRAG